MASRDTNDETPTAAEDGRGRTRQEEVVLVLRINEEKWMSILTHIFTARSPDEAEALIQTEVFDRVLTIGGKAEGRKDAQIVDDYGRWLPADTILSCIVSLLDLIPQSDHEAHERLVACQQ